MKRYTDFRVYEKGQGMLYTPNSILGALRYIFGRGIVDSGTSFHLYNPEYTPQYVLMRYIGKIGEEDVFEGDIFEYEYFNILGKKCYCNGYIWFDDEEKKYILKNKEGRDFGLEQITSCVLGNIHEHRELLEKNYL